MAGSEALAHMWDFQYINRRHVLLLHAVCRGVPAKNGNSLVTSYKPVSPASTHPHLAVRVSDNPQRRRLRCALEALMPSLRQHDHVLRTVALPPPRNRVRMVEL